MAGSWSHVVDRDTGQFRGVELLDGLGDAWEALEECYGMVYWLTKGDPELIKNAAKHYRDGIEMSPGIK